MVREVLALKGYDRAAKRFLLEPIYQGTKNQLDSRRSIQVAQDFLTRCFASCEFIALLLRREKTSLRDAESRSARTCRCTSFFWAGSRTKTRREPTSILQLIRFAPALGTHERKRRLGGTSIPGDRF